MSTITALSNSNGSILSVYGWSYFHRTRTFHESVAMSSSNSMQQCHSWEMNRSSTSLEIPPKLCIPEVHYHAHNSLLLISTKSHINPVHILPSYFLKIHVIIILTRISSLLTFYSYCLQARIDCKYYTMVLISFPPAPE